MLLGKSQGKYGVGNGTIEWVYHTLWLSGDLWRFTNLPKLSIEDFDNRFVYDLLFLENT